MVRRHRGERSRPGVVGPDVEPKRITSFDGDRRAIRRNAWIVKASHLRPDGRCMSSAIDEYQPAACLAAPDIYQRSVVGNVEVAPTSQALDNLRNDPGDTAGDAP